MHNHICKAVIGRKTCMVCSVLQWIRTEQYKADSILWVCFILSSPYRMQRTTHRACFAAHQCLTYTHTLCLSYLIKAHFRIVCHNITVFVAWNTEHAIFISKLFINDNRYWRELSNLLYYAEIIPCCVLAINETKLLHKSKFAGIIYSL